jgi:hypothetical protein
VLLAGFEIPESDVLELAVMLRRADYAHAADTIEGAVAAGLPDVALTIPDRTAILLTLDEPPGGPLGQLRGLLLAEHVGRMQDGLARRTDLPPER